MASPNKAEARAHEVLRPLFAAQAAQEFERARMSFRRARFTLGATLTIAAIYAGFIALRAIQGRALDAMNIIVVYLLVLGTANALKRYKSARSALHSSEQLAAT